MLRRRQDSQEVLDHHDEAMLGFGKAQGWDWWLWAQDQANLGQHLGQDTAIDAQRHSELRAPDMQTLFALGEQPLHELLEGLDEGTIGDITRQLVALASDEIAPLSD